MLYCREKAWHKKRAWVLLWHKSEFEKHFCHIEIVNITSVFSLFNTIVADEIESEMCSYNDGQIADSQDMAAEGIKTNLHYLSNHLKNNIWLRKGQPLRQWKGKINVY